MAIITGKRLDNIANRDKVIEAFKEIDLYRAKYRHTDFTPYAWCFHGEKTQGWTGQATNRRLVVQNSTIKIGSINADTHKYVSFNVATPGYWISHTTSMVASSSPSTKTSQPVYYIQPTATTTTTSIVSQPITTNVYDRYIDKSYLDTKYVTTTTTVSKATSICNACDVGEFNSITPDKDIWTTNPVQTTSQSSFITPTQTLVEVITSKQETIPAGYTLAMELTYNKIADGVISTYTKTLNNPIVGQEQFYFVDMTSEPDWNGTISRVELKLFPVKDGVVIRDRKLSEGYVVSPVTNLEYFKVDNVNIMAEAYDQIMVNAGDVNVLRTTIETLAKTTIDWDKAGASDDRVRQFLSVVKKNDYDSILTKIKTIEPYNGCATCDTFTCGCYQLHDGFIACQACDVCDRFNPCRTGCDVACYSEAVPCSCDLKCYQQAIVCGCNQKCYSYSACSCDMQSYGYSCRCDENCYSDTPPCTCNGTCDGHDPCKCNAQSVETDCSYCDHNSDVDCRSDSGSGCKCNAACYSDGSYDGSWNCKSCDVQCGWNT